MQLKLKHSAEVGEVKEMPAGDKSATSASAGATLEFYCTGSGHSKLTDVCPLACWLIPTGEFPNLKLVRQLTGELAVWFDGHAKSMDAVLAMFLKEVQYDPETRIVHKPQVLPEGVTAGECGVPLDETSPQQA